MSNPDKPDYTHGSTGQKPSQARDYENGDRLDANNLDYFINTPLEKIKAIIDTLVDIDSDGDGVVDRADSAVTADSADAYKGNDIDSDGDGKVNSAEQADNATTVKNNDIDSDGDGKVDSAESADDATNVTSTYKGNDIDSDGDGKVNSADQADNATTVKGNDIDFDGDGIVDKADDSNALGGNAPSTYFQFPDPSNIKSTSVKGKVDGWFTVADFTSPKRIITGSAASSGTIGSVRYTDSNGNTYKWDTGGDANTSNNNGVSMPPAKDISKVEAQHADDSSNDGSAVVYYL